MRPLRNAWILLLPLACSKQEATVDAAGDVAAFDAIADVVDPDVALSEERAKKLTQARASHTGPEIYATAIRTSVMNGTRWPEETDGGVIMTADVYRLGYLRHGSHATVFSEPIVNEDCQEGWYELLDGGFVCGKYASLDPKDPAVKFAANPPNLTAAMPYRYGFATRKDTPVYRRVLSFTDRKKFETWLAPPVPSVSASASASAPALMPSVASTEESDNPYEETPVEPPAKTRKGKDAGAPKDAGIKLGDLKGRGVLARKMMKGFYVALDRDFPGAKTRWWRTAEGFAIPFEYIFLQGWVPDFHGSWVIKNEDPDAGIVEGNGAAALVKGDFAVRYRQDDKGKMQYYGAALAKWTTIELAGDPLTVDGLQFQKTTGGFYVRLSDLFAATPEPPKDLAANEKWIDVDLGKQLLIAFEGTHPVYGTRVSSGKNVPWDPEHNKPTPTGTYRIYEKHISATMDGDVASDGPYSIEDVPWVMYFQGSYALHGAFWHNSFGSTRSHGCVNLAPVDARALFFWTEPQLPTGWHGVFQTGAKPGTRVIIHEPPQPKK